MVSVSPVPFGLDDVLGTLFKSIVCSSKTPFPATTVPSNTAPPCHIRTDRFYDVRPGGRVLGWDVWFPLVLLHYLPITTNVPFFGGIVHSEGEYRQRLRRGHFYRSSWDQWRKRSPPQHGGKYKKHPKTWSEIYAVTATIFTFISGAVFGLLMRRYVWSRRHAPIHWWLDHKDHSTARPLSSWSTLHIYTSTPHVNNCSTSITTSPSSSSSSASGPLRVWLAQITQLGRTTKNPFLSSKEASLVPAPFPVFAKPSKHNQPKSESSVSAGGTLSRFGRFKSHGRAALATFMVNRFWSGGASGVDLSVNPSPSSSSPSKTASRTRPPPSQRTSTVSVITAAALVPVDTGGAEGGKSVLLEYVFPFQSRVLRRRGYACGFSDGYGVSMWCSYALSELSLTCGGRSSQSRSESFLSDPDVPYPFRLSAKSFSVNSSSISNKEASPTADDDDEDYGGVNADGGVVTPTAKKSPTRKRTKSTPGWSSAPNSGTLRYSQAFDKGHLAPRASIGYSPAAARDTFFLTNVQLQTPYSNRVLMRKIEGLSRKMASGDRTQEVVLNLVEECNNVNKKAVAPKSISVSPTVVSKKRDRGRPKGKKSGTSNKSNMDAAAPTSSPGAATVIPSSPPPPQKKTSNPDLDEYKLLVKSAVKPPRAARVVARVVAQARRLLIASRAVIWRPGSPSRLHRVGNGEDGDNNSATLPMSDEQQKTMSANVTKDDDSTTPISSKRKRAMDIGVCTGPLFDRPPTSVVRLPQQGPSHLSPPVPFAFFCALYNTHTHQAVGFIVPNCPDSKTPFLGKGHQNATKTTTPTTTTKTLSDTGSTPSDASIVADSCPSRRRIRALVRAHRQEVLALSRLTFSSDKQTPLPAADSRQVEGHVEELRRLRAALVSYLQQSVTTTVVLPPKVLERAMSMVYAHSLDQLSSVSSGDVDSPAVQPFGSSAITSTISVCSVRLFGLQAASSSPWGGGKVAESGGVWGKVSAVAHRFIVPASNYMGH